MIIRTILCSICTGKIKLADEDEPYVDEEGKPICFDCFIDEYQGECGRCCNYVDNEEIESKPGELVVFFVEVPSYRREMLPGYYRVLKWPFYSQNIIGSGWIENGAVVKVADLDDEGKGNEEIIGTPCAPMCYSCRKVIEERTDYLRVL